MKRRGNYKWEYIREEDEKHVCKRRKRGGRGSEFTTRNPFFFDENHIKVLTAQAVYNLVTAVSVTKFFKVVTKLKKY
jgi:hypothetical protein